MNNKFTINFKVISAKNLIRRSLLRNPDPYIEIKTEFSYVCSKIIKKTINPFWNEDFSIDLSSLDGSIEIIIWDNNLHYKKRHSAFLGCAEINLSYIDPGYHTKTIKLLRSKLFSNKSVKGTFTCEITKPKNSNNNDNSNIPKLISNSVNSKSCVNNLNQVKESSQHGNRPKDRSYSASDALSKANNNSQKNGNILTDPLLPLGFEKRVTDGGKVFFIETNAGAIQWYHPGVPKFIRKATDDFSYLGELPRGWDSLTSQSGRRYFIDHTSRTTQYSDPRLLMALCQPNGQQFVIDKMRAAGINVKEYQGCQLNPDRPRNPHRKSVRYSNSNNNCLSRTSNGHIVSGDGETSSNGLHDDKNAGTTCNPSSCLPNTSNSHPFYLTEDEPVTLTAESLTRTRLISSNAAQPSDELTPHQLPDEDDYDGVDGDVPMASNVTTDSDDDDGDGDDSDACNRELAPLSFQRRRISRPTSEYVLSNKSTIDSKLKALRTQLKEYLQRKLCIIETSRDNILDRSFVAVRKLRTVDMRRRLVIKFTDEEGLDYGGLAREWLYLLSETLFSCRHGLFEASSANDGNLLRVSPLSAVNENHLRYFNFIGRIIGIAIFHGYYLDADFCRTFYKRILNQKPVLEDFKYFDIGIYSSLTWIINNDIDDADLSLTFSIEQEVFGQVEQIDLCQNGRNIPVTNVTKHAYVDRYVEYQLGEKCSNQYDQIRRGIYEVLPNNVLSCLNEHELEVLLTGISEIDISDWRKNTRLKHCQETDLPIQWFWQVVTSYSEQQRIKLLQFVTGSSRIPLAGFEGLRGSYGSEEPKLFTIKLVKSASPLSLPKAHTCFNRLDLPPYINYQCLKEKLTCAIEETCGFAVI